MKNSGILFIALLLLNACNNGESPADAYGNFEATEIIVSAESTGRLLHLHANEGRNISAGERVGLIDTLALSLQLELVAAQRETLENKIRSTQAEIAVLEEQLRSLMVEYRRVKALYADSAVAEQKYDEIHGQVQILERRIDAARSSLLSVRSEHKPLEVQAEQIREKIDRCVIKNPTRGTVLTRYSNTGEVTAYGKALYRLADLDTMTLRVYISGNQLEQVRIGQAAEVTVDARSGELKRYIGTVSWVAPDAEFTPKIIQTREERTSLVYAVKILVKNDGALKIGMPAEVNFK